MELWISCLVLLVPFATTLAASCENKVRLADLQDVIKNQTKLIGNMEHVIEDQKNLIENQAISIENQTRLYEDLQATVEYLKTGERQLLFQNKEWKFHLLQRNFPHRDHVLVWCFTLCCHPIISSPQFHILFKCFKVVLWDQPFKDLTLVV